MFPWSRDIVNNMCTERTQITAQTVRVTISGGQINPEPQDPKHIGQTSSTLLKHKKMRKKPIDGEQIEERLNHPHLFHFFCIPLPPLLSCASSYIINCTFVLSQQEPVKETNLFSRPFLGPLFFLHQIF